MGKLIKFKSNINKVKAPKILTQNEIKYHIKSIDIRLAKTCYLFGSYSKNRANLFSDIDILLIFDDMDYKDIRVIIDNIKEYFLNIGYVCNPIYSYFKYLKEDSNILIRQYIKNGVLLFGDNLTEYLPFESNVQLQQKEYQDYWLANCFKKLETLKYILKDDNIDGCELLYWQYIYLIVYWYAKAELTLVNKQYSLNEYTLIYIYENMLNKKLDEVHKAFLNMTDEYRERFYTEEVDNKVQNPKGYLNILTSIVNESTK